MALAELPDLKRTAADLGSALLGVADCPEYEELSAHIERTLGETRARAVSAHVNTCELCSADISRIEELRSQAELRGKVTVQPGMSRRRTRGTFGLWQRMLAGTVVAGAVVAVVVSFSGFGKSPANKTVVALKPPVGVERPKPESKHNPVLAPAPEVKPGVGTDVAANPANSGSAVTPPAAPAYRTLLKDGSYRLIRKNGEISLAKADGNSIRTPLEARVWASVQEKLRTGKIKSAEPIRVAMNTGLRDRSGYTPPPTAPEPVAPVGKLVLSNRPTLSWSKVDLADSYRVLVASEDGNVVFEGTTNGTSLALSTPLERGRVYNWQVGVRFSESDSWANSKAARFKVLSADDLASIQRVRSTMPGSHLALGAAYESLGLQDEAAKEYRALLRQNPGSPLARKLASR